MEVLVEQPLALPGSAKYLDIVSYFSIMFLKKGKIPWTYWKPAHHVVIGPTCKLHLFVKPHLPSPR